MTDHRNSRPRVHRPVAPAAEQPFWKRLKVRVITLTGLALTSFLSLVLFPVAKDLLSDKAKEATAGPVMWASAMSEEPEEGCAALGDRLGARDRSALELDSDVGTIVQGHGAWVRELPIDLSLRGGTGQATVTAIGIRPRERVEPPLSAALLCHSTAGTPPVARLTANLDVAPPVVKLEGKRYGDGSVITVGPGEQVPAHLKVSLTRGYLEFDVVLTYAYKDKAAVTLPVYDGDPKLKRPFRITGAAPRYQDIYIKGSGYNRATPRKACAFLPLKGC